MSEIDRNLYAKIEFLHPSGSLKHRALPPFLDARHRSGEIRPGQRLAILSAGSAGISLAWAAARMGHRAIVVLPWIATPQMIRIVEWLGAECRQIADEQIGPMMAELASDRDVYLVEQTREARLIDYYRPVASEILLQLPECAAITIGIGSGLSITGIGRELRDRGATCRVLGVEPAEAAVASGGAWAPHSLLGLAPPVPQPLFDRSVVSEILRVPSDEAWMCARDVYRRTGLPIGPSSGATVAAALQLRKHGVAGPMVALCASSIGECLERAPTSTR